MPPQASIRLYGELNDFLPPGRRGHPQIVPLPKGEHPALKQVLASLGVPPVEVGCARLNGARVPLSIGVPPASRVEAHPWERGRSPLIQGENAPRFVLDNHLGRLASYLRILGFDTLYRNDYQDEELARLAAAGRILLTRDRQLLMRNAVRYGRWMRSKNPREQLREVVTRFGLQGLITPLQRCPRCNAPLETVEKSAVLEQLEPLTRLYYDTFKRCTACGQIYWQGSHYERMRLWLEEVLDEG